MNKKFQELIIEACEILDASYSFKEDEYEIEVFIDEERTQLVSVYLTIDSFDYEKIMCLVEIGPIVKNTELLYTFLKNNFELDYGSYAIINDDDIELLVLSDSTILESCTAEELATIINYLAEIADETEDLLTKYKN